MAGIFHVPISGFTQVEGEQDSCFSIALMAKGWGVFNYYFSLFSSGKSDRQGGSRSSTFSWYLVFPWQLPLGSSVTGEASSAGQLMVEACQWQRRLRQWAGNMSCDSSVFNTTSLLPRVGPDSLGSWSHQAGTVNLRLYFLSGCFLARGAQAFEVRKDHCKHSVISSIL